MIYSEFPLVEFFGADGRTYGHHRHYIRIFYGQELTPPPPLRSVFRDFLMQFWNLHAMISREQKIAHCDRHT